ncbi:unnamed protein product, partial [Brenthis ino]
MDMFHSVLEIVPQTRLEMVNDLEIPEDISVTPYEWCEETLDSDSIPSVSVEEFDVKTVSSESSLALSRAMTDSEIDYARYRRLKSRSFSDSWVHMRAAIEAFPPGYLDSLNRSVHFVLFSILRIYLYLLSFQNTPPESTEDTYLAKHRYNEELRLKMQRFFDEECRVFSPDDPGLIVLEEALRNVDIKDTDIDSSTSGTR